MKKKYRRYNEFQRVVVALNFTLLLAITSLLYYRKIEHKI